MQTNAANLMQQAKQAAKRRDAAFLESQLAKVPAALHLVMRKQYGYLLTSKNQFAANTWLRYRVNSPAMEQAREAGALLDEEETRQLGEIKAENTSRKIDEKALGKFAASRAALCDDSINKAVSEVPDQYKQLAAVMAAGRAILDAKVKPSSPAGEENPQGFVLRAKCSIWWRRQLRRQSAQALDQCHRELGRVRRGLEVYCADATVTRRRAQNAKNREALEATLMESDDGIRATLADLADRSTANPELRRIELMVRCRGIEEWAKQVGYVSEFWTITAPSKYHRFRHGGEKVLSNRNWSRATPAQVSRYLAKLWSHIRAEFNRQKITVVGLRVAEPHHDGTPHWHILAHMPEAQRDIARAIVRKHALAEDGDEKGAEAARFEAIGIDPNRGSATGYIAKYVAKNISGNAHAADDHEAQDATRNTVDRVGAWAACWRIRQFQFFGLKFAPVGLWRCVRSIRDPIEFDDAIEKLRLSADRGDYGDFMQQCAKHVAKLVTETSGELGSYGDVKPPIPVAISAGIVVMPLQRREWRMVIGDRSPFGLDFDSARENRVPRSSGNNCTGVSDGRKARTASAGDCSENGRIKSGAGANADGKGRRNSASARSGGKSNAGDGGAAGPHERGIDEAWH